MVWGLGRYERTAERLMPAAEVVVDQARPRSGEHVVDLGTGTGNAALLAARAGANVTGIDPAPRLLEVATQLADEAGLTIEFRGGESAAMPLPDAFADAIISVFAVIFADDPAAAAAEIARVRKPNGRFVMSAWVPGGPVTKAMQVTSKAMGAEERKGFDWHDPDTLAELFAPHDMALETWTEHQISFTSSSAYAYVEEESTEHPLWILGMQMLERQGADKADALREEVVEIFDAANEDPDAFRITSTYRVLTLS
jgi:ubiquinone/menaquinone biosynthesis C-methylase UbiE